MPAEHRFFSEDEKAIYKYKITCFQSITNGWISVLGLSVYKEEHQIMTVSEIPFLLVVSTEIALGDS